MLEILARRACLRLPTEPLSFLYFFVTIRSSVFNFSIIAGPSLSKSLLCWSLAYRSRHATTSLAPITKKNLTSLESANKLSALRTNPGVSARPPACRSQCHSTPGFPRRAFRNSYNPKSGYLQRPNNTSHLAHRSYFCH